MAKDLLGESLLSKSLLGKSLLSKSLLGKSLLAKSLLGKSLLAKSLLGKLSSSEAGVSSRIDGSVVDDLVGVDGGLNYALCIVGFSMRYHGHYTLTMDDGLHLMDDVGNNVGVHKCGPLHCAANVGRGSLSDVLLDVVHHVSVHFTMYHRLYLHYPVLADSLLHYGSDISCGLVDNGLVDICGIGSQVLAREVLSRDGLLSHRCTSSCGGGLVVVGDLVQ